MKRPERYEWIAALLIAGCSGSVSKPSSDASPKQAADSAAQPSASTQDSPPEKSVSGAATLSVGPISFTPPPGWEVRETGQPPGLTIFAPERPEWRAIGFRPNLGVRVRPHPGVSLESFHEKLKQTLEQSVAQMNATIQSAQPNATRPGIALAEKSEYSLSFTDVDEVRGLATSFSGAFELRSGLVATKTLGLQILVDSDAHYSIALTFPSEFEKEMAPAWESFVESLRIRK